MLRVLTISLVAASVIAAEAEPRWCSVKGKAIEDRVSYPPMAKAARVSGVVVSRVIFAPSGKVERLEPIFGPPMLFNSLEQQMVSWTLKSDAQGDRPCEALMIASFQLKEPASCGPPPDVPTEYDFSAPGLLRFDLNAHPYLICDPAGSTVTPLNGASLLFYKVKRGFGRLFRNR